MEQKKKTTKKSTAPKIKDLDNQQRRLALLKQKQCDGIALHIVNKLIESAVEEDVFLQSLKYINQCHYQDIVEERAISKICGYPICSLELPDMPKKQYHISTKLNKVYDITDRKNYCSNFCYKAGNHIKEQMLTSPLWYRDQEKIPDFKLLANTESGIPGIEIDQGIVKVDVDEVKDFTSVSELTENLMNDIPNEIQNKINIDCAKAEDNTNNITLTKEKNNDHIEENVKIDDLREEDLYFSNIYSSSLADILKENSEYFSNQSSDKIIDSKLTDNIDVPIVIENTNKNGPKQEPEIINKKLTDRTLINNKCYNGDNTKVKSILSKEKMFSVETKKKKVSFSSENYVHEIEKIDNNSYKENEIKAQIEPIKYKNSNLIGSVKEKCNTYKYQIAPKHNENTDINEIDKSKLENSKEKRLNRLKNSSSYKKANRMSKIQVAENQNEIFSNLKLKLQTYTEEWCTMDTFIFLLGEEYVKKIMTDKTFTEYMNKKKNIEFDDIKQRKYDEMCKRLNLLELVDKKYDESVTGKKLRPLPRFEELRDQAEKMDLRVQAFYSGCLEEYDEDGDSETESTKDENESCIMNGAPAVLPLIDSKDFHAIRRKIFLSSISRSIHVICEILEQTPNCLLSDIKQLIDTFEFTANNIVFKTGEWQLVIVVLMKLLENKNTDMKNALNSDEMKLFINILKEKFNMKDQSVEWLFDFIDVDKLLDICTKKISMK